MAIGRVESGLADIVVELAAAEPLDVGAELFDPVTVFDRTHGVLDALQCPAGCVDDVGEVVEVASACHISDGGSFAAYDVVEDQSKAAADAAFRVGGARVVDELHDDRGSRSCVDVDLPVHVLAVHCLCAPAVLAACGQYFFRGPC